MPVDENGLTIKQKLFCENYLANGYNATQAAKSSGYSEDTVGAIGRENLQKPLISKYIGNRMKEIFEKVGANAEWRADMLKKTAEASLHGKASKHGIINTSGIIGSIAEMNKMEGTYAAEKHAVLVEEDKEGKVSDLLKKYESEY